MTAITATPESVLVGFTPSTGKSFCLFFPANARMLGWEGISAKPSFLHKAIFCLFRLLLSLTLPLATKHIICLEKVSNLSYDSVVCK